MVRQTVMMALIAGLSFSVPQALAADIGTPEGFMVWNTPAPTMVDAPMAVLDERYTGFPDLVEEGRPELTINIRMINRYRPGDERIIVDAIETGYADDSASGGWERFMLQPMEDGALALVAHGWKWQCARGAVAGQWVSRPCP
ncbi:MAG: hypothetical protein AAF940_03290 [Pseudomonadota bacterium]